MTEQLEKLLEDARSWPFSEVEQEQQRRSFAFGNASIENPLVTRAIIDAAAEMMANQKA